jgi:hypothetical protein
VLDEAALLLVNEGTTNAIQGSNTELSPQDMVTEIITVGVKPGMEEAYRARVDRSWQTEARRLGYQGLQLQPPIPGLQDNLVSLIMLRYLRESERLARIRRSSRRPGRGRAVYRAARTAGRHRLLGLVYGR